MKLAIKGSVALDSLRPQMVLAAVIVANVYEERGFECVITSANDSKHRTASLHYAGQALDFRTRNVPDNGLLRQVIAAKAKERLGDEFDVVLEDDHLHVEYQPKRRKP